MLTQFPVDSIAQLCTTLAADMNKQLVDTNFNIYTLLLLLLLFFSGASFCKDANTEMCWSEGTSLPRGRSCGSFSILGNGPILYKPGNLDGDNIARSGEF